MSTLADSIAIGRVGSRPLEVMNIYINDMVLVSEDTIARLSDEWYELRWEQDRYEGVWP